MPPALKSLLALLGAVALVGGAILVRGALDTHETNAGLTLRITCSDEVASTCDALSRADKRVKATVAPAGTTADRLVGLDPDADPGVDGWVVAGPWPSIVDGGRQLQSKPALFGAGAPALARSPLIVGLRGVCSTDRTWKCLAASVGVSPFRDLGLPSVRTSGVGVAGLAALTGGALDTTDFASNDLSDDRYAALAGRLGARHPQGR